MGVSRPLPNHRSISLIFKESMLKCVCVCVSVYVYSQVCKRTCMWVCICVWKPAQITCLPQLLSTLHTEKLELISSARLANQPAPWAPCLCLPLLGFQMGYRVQTAFTWVPGIRTLVLTFAQQTLSTLSHIPSSEIYNFKLLYFLLWGWGVPGHTCKGQRTIGRSWLLSAIMWTLGDQTQVISVGDKGFYPPPGPPASCLSWTILP